MALRKRISSHAGSSNYIPPKNNLITESTCTCNTQAVSEYDYQTCIQENDCRSYYCRQDEDGICSSYLMCPSNCYCYTVERCVAEVVTCRSVCKPQTPGFTYIPYTNSTAGWGKYTALSVTCLSNFSNCLDNFCMNDTCLGHTCLNNELCASDTSEICVRDLILCTTQLCESDKLCAIDGDTCNVQVCSIDN